jgi:hypothetical protein
MRDLINLITEANLGAPEIPATKASAVKNPVTGKVYSRPELFLQKVKGGSPFTLVKGGEVTIDPKEARNVAAWIKTGPMGPKGTISMRTTDGGTVKNTDLLKTVEFGSKESETIKLKGGDVFDTTDQEVADFGNSVDQLLKSGGFPASEMYAKISSSPQMQKLGKIGDAVIYMSRQAAEGQVPEFPPDLTPAEIKAIELYASEYIGVLGLLSGATKFKRGSRAEFDKFVGASLNDMIMYFPKAGDNPLADSFSVVNDETGHAVKISSKAAGKGAPPALSSIKIPANVQKKYPKAYSFYKEATNPGYSAFTQPFGMMNWMQKNVPDQVPAAYKKLLPFDDSLISAAQESSKSGRPMPKGIMSVFNKRLSPKVQDSENTDGGKIWYAVTKDIIDLINNQEAVEGFRPAIIQSLGYNFIQLYTNVKGNKLVTEAFWPATVSGEVRLKTKGSASDPVKGKISVEVSPGKGDDDMGPEIGTSAVQQTKTKTKDLDAVTQTRSSIKAAPDEPKKYGTPKTLGRKRQK